MEDKKKFWVFVALCAALALLYFVAPVDFVPDLIAGIGWIDDLIISICGLGGLVLNICWALGVLPAPGNNDDGYEDDYNYDGEYGYYREV